MADESIQIREVWEYNLESEFAIIREIVDEFPYVALDTEFPGVVVRPVGTFPTRSDYQYQMLKANVNILKLIQLGLTFSDEHGNLTSSPGDPTRKFVWQFNFREFDPEKDVFAPDSVEMLGRSGIDFSENAESGVDTAHFAELLMSSGVVLNDEIKWVTFHSIYDFGYLLKLLTSRLLPETQAEFLELIKVFFPMFYDIKHLMNFCNSMHGGLNRLAELLEVERIGTSHQAGSDSLLTARCFRKLTETFFNGSAEKYSGVLYGLGIEAAESDK